MITATVRTAGLQVRSFHKTALNSVFTETATRGTNESYLRHHRKHNKVEYSQSPVTPYNTNVRAEWQRHRATEHHQIWPSSPQKHSFHTKLSSQETSITKPTHAMTFRKDREMHIAARQTSLKAPEEHENPDREFMKTWLGVKREFGYLRSDLLDAVLADGKKVQNQSFMGRLFDSESKTQH
jgi:hypothetical protein